MAQKTLKKEITKKKLVKVVAKVKQVSKKTSGTGKVLKSSAPKYTGKTVSAKTLSAPKSSVAVKKESQKAPASKSVDRKLTEAKITTTKTVVAKTTTAKVMPLKTLYKVGNYVVYPTHGVGKIMAEETQMIGDIELRMLVISFEKDKMTLRVPLSRASAAGLRPVSSVEQMKKVFVTLKSRARTSRGMWSRRAQEYETKINSGNIHFIAEVVRDLHQNVDQSERSYSERMIYESALSRLVGELAACEGTDYKTATDKLMKLLRSKIAAANEEIKEAA
ncbi:MAG: CarD family transcriptional regulator [Pseudomonadota bacterium]